MAAQAVVRNTFLEMELPAMKAQPEQTISKSAPADTSKAPPVTWSDQAAIAQLRDSCAQWNVWMQQDGSVKIQESVKQFVHEDDITMLTDLGKVLLSNAHKAACDPYGNYALTVFIELAPPELSVPFIDALLPHAQNVSVSKFGYRVVCAMLRKFGFAKMQKFFEQLNLKDLIEHRYGNFVSTSFLIHGSNEQRNELVATICQNMKKDYLVGYPSHVVAAASGCNPTAVIAAVDSCMLRDEALLQKILCKADAVSLLWRLVTLFITDSSGFQSWLYHMMNKYSHQIRKTLDRKTLREAGKHAKRAKRAVGMCKQLAKC